MRACVYMWAEGVGHRRSPAAAACGQALLVVLVLREGAAVHVASGACAFASHVRAPATCERTTKAAYAFPQQQRRSSCPLMLERHAQLGACACFAFTHASLSHRVIASKGLSS